MARKFNVLHCDGWVVSTFEKCSQEYVFDNDSTIPTLADQGRAAGWSVDNFGVSAYCPEHRLP